MSTSADTTWIAPPNPTRAEYFVLLGIGVAYHLGIGIAQSQTTATGPASNLILGFVLTRTIPALLSVAVFVHLARKGVVQFPAATRMLTFGLAAGFMWLALDGFGIWHYAWRGNTGAAVSFVRLQLDSGTTPYALIAWALVATIGIPLIEELVYRRGAASFIASVTRSRVVGAAIGAVLFAAVHAGAISAQQSLSDAIQLSVCYWAFGFGLGLLTLKRADGLPIAVLLHCTKNLVETLVLVLGASAGRS